jgi:hypothetical protein
MFCRERRLRAQAAQEEVCGVDGQRAEQACILQQRTDRKEEA